MFCISVLSMFSIFNPLIYNRIFEIFNQLKLSHEIGSFNLDLEKKK